MSKRILIHMGILLAIEIALFIGLISTSMTDEKPPAIAHYFYWTLKYPFGFPLVLLNNEFPYFLDDNNTPTVVIILMSILNNFILALGIVSIMNFFRRNLKN